MLGTLALGRELGDALATNSAITKEVKSGRKNLVMTWVDYFWKAKISRDHFKFVDI